jgi:hypothetical protein
MSSNEWPNTMAYQGKSTGNRDHSLVPAGFHHELPGLRFNLVL